SPAPWCRPGRSPRARHPPGWPCCRPAPSPRRCTWVLPGPEPRRSRSGHDHPVVRSPGPPVATIRRRNGPVGTFLPGARDQGGPHTAVRDGAPVAERADEELLRATLAAVAPGTELRDGLERVLSGRTGALIVMGFDRVVESLCSGGFELDVEFSATRLRELAKMDGAIVLDREGTRILRAATQLVPDPSIETRESGTRHRTAERVAKQTGHPVVSVSQSMAIVAIYVGGERHVLEAPTAILSRANQALQTLARYKPPLDEASSNLSALEIEDLVTIRDVTAVLQRLEMVRRISDEIAQYALELGTDGRLMSL